MKSEFDGHARRTTELLLQAVEELERRQERLESLMERIIAEQEEIRRRQDDLIRQWQDFGQRLNVYSAAWGTHLEGQMKQLEEFTKRLAELLPEE